MDHPLRSPRSSFPMDGHDLGIPPAKEDPQEPWFALHAQANTTFEQRARTRTTVWGEAKEEQVQTVVSRLHGPEAGVIWTSHAALGAVQHAIGGDIRPGFQTASLAYGADFVLECEEIRRENLG